MPIAAVCPQCCTRLKISEKLLGKNVKCPKCGRLFEAGPEETSAPSASRNAIKASAPIPGPPPRGEDAERPRRTWDEESPRSRPRRRRARNAVNQNLLIAFAVGGAVFVVGIVIVLIVSRGRDKEGRVPPVVAKEDAAVERVRAKPPEIKNRDVNQPNVRVRQQPVADDPGAKQPGPHEAPIPVQEPDRPRGVPDAPMQPAPANAPAPPALEGIAGALKAGTKITVRAAVQGSPPGYVGDYNKAVAQNLEIALRGLGLEPVAEGGLPLLIQASPGSSGKEIKVRRIGAPPPPLTPRTTIKGGKIDTSRPAEQTQTYSVPQITASVLVTDTQGVALWKKEGRFIPITGIFTGDPAQQMQEQMWRSFDARTRVNLAPAPMP